MRDDLQTVMRRYMILVEAAQKANPADRMVSRYYRVFANEGDFGHVDVDMEAQSPDTVTLLNIFSKRQKHGIGTAVLQQICRLADEYQVYLELQLQPSGIPYDKLVGWYRRFGFSPDMASKGAWMVRHPHRTVREAAGTGGAALAEAVFTTAPQKQVIWGMNHAPWQAFQSDELVPVYYRLSAPQMIGLLNKHRQLRAVITDNEVYAADASVAAHAGIRSVLKDYGVDVTDCINAIITGPKRMVYAFGKYARDDSQERGWRKIRNDVMNNPRIKIMFPNGFAFVRNDWT